MKVGKERKKIRVKKAEDIQRVSQHTFRNDSSEKYNLQTE